ncbi:hypothetical protein GQ457_06G004780 [Hibiscus cannabinus]
MVETTKAPKLLHGGRNLCCSVYIILLHTVEKESTAKVERFRNRNPGAELTVNTERELLGPQIYNEELYAAFGKDELLLKRNLLILVQLVGPPRWSNCTPGKE